MSSSVYYDDDGDDGDGLHCLCFHSCGDDDDDYCYYCCHCDDDVNDDRGADVLSRGVDEMNFRCHLHYDDYDDDGHGGV